MGRPTFLGHIFGLQRVVAMWLSVGFCRNENISESAGRIDTGMHLTKSEDGRY